MINAIDCSFLSLKKSNEYNFMIIGEITDLTQVSIGNELIEEALKWVAEHHKDPFENGSIFIREDQKIKVNYETVAMLPQG